MTGTTAILKMVLSLYLQAANRMISTTFWCAYVYLDFEKSDDEKYKFANTKWQTAAMLKTFLVIAYLGGIVQLRQSVEWGSRITHMGRSPHDPIVKFRKFKIADGDHFDSGRLGYIIRLPCLSCDNKTSNINVKPVVYLQLITATLYVTDRLQQQCLTLT